MTKMKIAGLNTIQTYVEWSSHEKRPGNYTGLNDIVSFIKTAQDAGLDVILRPGPFIDAERDFGGLPSWLLKNPDVKLRTSDKYFMERVTSWYTKLFSFLTPLLFKNGGPITMVQVENEYGSFALQTGHKDVLYLEELRDLIKHLVGNDVLLYSTDGAGFDYVNNSVITGVFPTVDYGCGGNVDEAFKVQRTFEPGAPLVNSEYYSGWLDHWQHPHSTSSTSCVVSTLDKMLAAGANVNIYMFHGGTSFGFSAGSNSGPFLATPTSYDYDAPISEAGDLTEKFWSIRSTVGKYLPLPPVPDDLQNVTEKGNYGSVKMQYVSNIFTSITKLSTTRNTSTYPINFERLNQSSGFMIYETKISDHRQTDPVLLSVPGLRDRGYIFLDYHPKGILSRIEDIYSLPLQVLPNQTLSIVVENQGRICFGADLADRKGILGNVTLGNKVLTDWKMIGLPLDNGNQVLKYVENALKYKTKKRISKYSSRDELEGQLSGGKMTFWHGEFTLGNSLETRDTFLSIPDWHKGVAWINGFNLGRYWPAVGPQMTLYVPKFLLKQNPDVNNIILFEQDQPPCDSSSKTTCIVSFIEIPDINGKTPNY